MNVNYNLTGAQRRTTAGCLLWFDKKSDKKCNCFMLVLH